MGWMSPNELKENPEKWLDIPHELHESIFSLMQMMYDDGFEVPKHIHCLECEGHEPFDVISPEGPGIVTGYKDVEGGEPLLYVSYPEKAEV